MMDPDKLLNDTQVDLNQLYQHFRAAAGSVQSVARETGMDEEELHDLAREHDWFRQLDNDGALYRPGNVEDYKNREIQTMMQIAAQMDNILLADQRIERRAHPRQGGRPTNIDRARDNAVDDLLRMMPVGSEQWRLLQQRRIDTGKYLQLLMGEPTSRSEVREERLDRLGETLNPEEIRALREKKRELKARGSTTN